MTRLRASTVTPMAPNPTPMMPESNHSMESDGARPDPEARRLDRLLRDVESQFAHEQDLELRATAEELMRAESAQVSVQDRLRAAHGQMVQFLLRGGQIEQGTITVTGTDWVEIVRRHDGARVLLPGSALVAVQDLPLRVRSAPADRGACRSWGGRLRDLVRDRALVTLSTSAGALCGRLSRVGADAVELAVVPTGERAALSGGRMTVLLAQVNSVIVH